MICPEINWLKFVFIIELGFEFHQRQYEFDLFIRNN